MSLRNWILLLLLGSIWGGSFIFAKVAVAEIPALILVFLRVFSAALALHVVLRIRKLSFPTQPSLLAAFLIMGLLNNAVPFSLLFWGQTEISAALASILNATTPIFTFLIAAIMMRQETINLHRIAGVLTGFAGVVCMLLPSMSGTQDSPLWAQFACLGAALSYGLAAAYARRFKDTPPLVSATGQLTGSSLIMLPLAVMSASSWSPAQTSSLAWVCVIALGLLATAAAYLIYFRLLASAGATNASLVTLIVPATAILFGVTLLGEGLSQAQMFGLTLLALGLIILDGRVFRAVGLKT
ncbi:DMT family transporter [Roseibium sp.]|uniref:DMT family transporter n=1 Tax=Roseibium sp. TaxID=1936156 RepID=UPI003A986E8F